MTTKYWRIEAIVPARAERVFTNAFALFGDSVSSFERDLEVRSVAAICSVEPMRSRLETALAIAAASGDCAVPRVQIDPIEEADWLVENRKSFPPIQAGRYFIFGAHFDGNVPAGCIGIELDAGPAFGSGRHESTRGCLLALEHLSRQRNVTSALDLGCGSGILAIAVARTWGAAVLAIDHDDRAVEVTRFNARRNGVERLLDPHRGDGMKAPLMAQRGPFDLIIANLQHEPLEMLAADLLEHLCVDGVAVLSGVLSDQSRALATTYGAHGAHETHRITVGGWDTLVFGR